MTKECQNSNDEKQQCALLWRRAVWRPETPATRLQPRRPSHSLRSCYSGFFRHSKFFIRISFPTPCGKTWPAVLMDDAPPNYHREFLKSPQHAILGVLTLGAGFMSGMLLPLIAGATLYTLGWIYVPDFPFFRRWVDRRRDAAKRAAEAQQVADFVQR